MGKAAFHVVFTLVHAFIACAAAAVCIGTTLANALQGSNFHFCSYGTVTAPQASFETVLLAWISGGVAFVMLCPWAIPLFILAAALSATWVGQGALGEFWSHQFWLIPATVLVNSYWWSRAVWNFMVAKRSSANRRLRERNYDFELGNRGY